MRSPKSRGLVAGLGLVIVAFACHFAPIVCDSKNVERPVPANFATQRYRLDSSQSKFIAHAVRGGLLWFKGHDHLISGREFTGEAQMTPESITPASPELTAKKKTIAQTSNLV